MFVYLDKGKILENNTNPRTILLVSNVFKLFTGLHLKPKKLNFILRTQA